MLRGVTTCLAGVWFLLGFPLVVLTYVISPVYLLWTTVDPIFALLVGGLLMPAVMAFGVFVITHSIASYNAQHGKGD